MQRIGYRKIAIRAINKSPRNCVNCGRTGKYHVTFEDMNGRLCVTLCEKCKDKQYRELRLQSRFDWPNSRWRKG